MGRKKGKKRDATAGKPQRAQPPAADAQTLSEARALQAQELEVLQAIFDRDLRVQSATPLYAHIFSVRLLCEATPGAAATATAEVLLHFDLPRAYPLTQAPHVAVEPQHGLSDPDALKLTRELELLARGKVGDAMVYDLVVCATDFLQDHVKDQSSFFDQMVQRQQDAEAREKQTQDALRLQAQQQAQQQNAEILALIDAERRKKREKMHKRSVSRRRRRRRHRSSWDGHEDDEGDEDDEDSDGRRAGLGDDVESMASVEQRDEQRDADERSQSRSGRSDSEASELDAATAAERVNSRYHGDFRELGLLGRGGGGEVVKVRNRLDRQLYAVKKIKLDPEDPTMKRKILREVKTISRISHRHIVRYFQAWIEGERGVSSDNASDCASGESDEGDESDEDALLDALNPLSSVEDDVYGDVSTSSGAGGGGETQLSAEDDEDDWLGTMSSSVGLWSSSRPDSRSHRSASHAFQLSAHGFEAETYPDDGFDWEALEEASLEDEDASDSEAGGQRKAAASRATASASGPGRRRKVEKLYIQMEYCEGKALREVIDKGALWKDPDKVWTMFRQILEALVYIHRQGIIHRDIKPPNIFLDAEGTVKLGDFGLAVRPPKILEDSSSSNDEAGGSGLGTATGAFLAESTGSSAAELYGRLKLENLESTRVSGPARAAPRDGNVVTTMSTDVGDGSITAGVGTAFYRAPEQEREGQRYNQKADMFALGVLFFEMWMPPFTTLMERAQALTGLREKHELPAGFAGPDNVHQIVLWLCHRDPSRRPNAKELLASALLPAKMEVEGTYLREALDTLANPEGKFFGQLIDALVAQEPVSHVDYTYDHVESVKLRSYVSELRTKTHVKGVLQKVFERHGAVELTTPLLMPRPPERNFTGVPLSTPQSSSALLDSSGVSVSLPFDLTERLARFVARHNLTRLKCYQFDRVYRRTGAGGHPRELLESDFDLVWDDRGPFRFLELEGLQVVAEVLQLLASSLGAYYLRLNDARVTRGLLELCHVPANARREVLKLLANEVALRVHAGPSSTLAPTLKAGRWKFVAKRMKQYGTPAAAVDALKPFFLLPEDCLAALDVLEHEVQRLYAWNRARAHSASASPTVGVDDAEDGDTPTACAHDRKQAAKRDAQLRRVVKDVDEGLASLRSVLQGVQFLRLAGPVCTRIDLGLSPRPERYASGFLFQAVLVGEAAASSSPCPSRSPSVTAASSQVTIAEGGRYDSLVTRFKLPAAYVKSSSVAAMGVRFSIDKMVSCVLGASSPTLLEPKAPAASDVLAGGRKLLICSAGSRAADTTLLRMQLALLLWDHGLGADYLHPEPLHLEDLEDYCAQQGVQYMVIVQKHLLKEKQQVKVRAVKSHSEADVVVNVTSLVEYVRDVLAGPGKHAHGESHAGGSGHYGDAGGGTGGGASALAGGAVQPIFDVKLVDAKYQSRDRNSRNYQLEMQKITRRVAKWLSSSFSSRGDEAMKVLSVDLPFALVRELSSALMNDGKAGIDAVCADYPRYRKQLKYTMEELAALAPEQNARVGRERYVLLHSLVDDRYDMMSLAPPTKSGRKTSPSSRKNL